MKTLAFSGLLSLCMAGAASAGGGDMRVENAREDLARRLKMSPELVEIVSQREVVWPDSNMGCRRVGSPVEKVPTGGTELVLFANGHTHYYHAKPGEAYQYCELPSTKRTGPIEGPKQ